MGDESKTKEKILEAALHIIGDQGLQSLTVRKVAKIAAVNVAAINYHFGSKEQLLKQTMAFFFNKMNGVFSILEEPGYSEKEKIYKTMEGFYEIISTYPGFIKSTLLTMMSKGPPNFFPLQGIKMVQTKLVGLLKEFYHIEDENLIRMKLFQVISSLIYPVLIGDYSKKVYNLDLSTKEQKNTYFTLLLEIFYGGK